MDRNKVCDGIRDCPNGEDEKKCAALIEEYVEDYEKIIGVLKNKTSNGGGSIVHYGSKNDKEDDALFAKSEDYSYDSETIDRDVTFDQEAVESTLSKSTTLPDSLELSSSRESYGSIVETTIMPDVSTNSPNLVSGREISLNTRNGLVDVGTSTFRAKEDSLITSARVYGKEFNGYNDKGYLNIRKNGKWGKLCLNSTNNFRQEKQTTWTIEDLGRAVCKAITYQ